MCIRDRLKHIARDPANHRQSLPCVALLLKRGETLMLLPENKTELNAFDQLLFCGPRKVKHSMTPALTDINLLNYVMTSKSDPQSYIWIQVSRLMRKQERRTSSR